MMDSRSLVELLERRNNIKEKYENLKQKISKKENLLKILILNLKKKVRKIFIISYLM